MVSISLAIVTVAALSSGCFASQDTAFDALRRSGWGSGANPTHRRLSSLYGGIADGGSVGNNEVRGPTDTCSYQPVVRDLNTPNYWTMEAWHHCVPSEGAIPLDEDDAASVTADSVESCFERCREEPLCTAFEAIPHVDGGGVSGTKPYAGLLRRKNIEYCKLWTVCKAPNTFASSVSAPLNVNAFSLTGECLRDHVDAVRDLRWGASQGIVDKLHQQVNSVLGVEDETVYAHPEFPPLVAELVNAAWPRPRKGDVKNTKTNGAVYVEYNLSLIHI